MKDKRNNKGKPLNVKKKKKLFFNQTDLVFKGNFSKLIFIVNILLAASLIVIYQFESAENNLSNTINGTTDINTMGINATGGYRQRQNTYLKGCKTSDQFYAQAARLYLGLPVNEESIEKSLERVNSLKDGTDFTLNSLVRLMYINQKKHVLQPPMRTKVADSLLNCKYWHTEGGREDNMIFWTENHQILFHTAELLAGQLYPDEVFTNSGMNGTAHIEHALLMVKRWINWRAQFGFVEWHSNTYFKMDIAALVNLVDFAQDTEVATKAAMVLDLLAFDFANNYYKGSYATTHGRAYDRSKVGKSLHSPASRDSTSEPAWIMLGIGEHDTNDKGNIAAIALATSDRYVPPPILEYIAKRARASNEHKERSSIDIADGPKYGIGYTSEEDIMLWWTLSAPVNTHTIEASIELIEKYDLKTDLILGPSILLDLLEIGSKMHGVSLSEYSDMIKAITQGVCLETVNTYTYRTLHYQLSGAQDHQKGMNGMQEHIWQASLDDNAFVYTNSPGGLSKDFKQLYVGGWKPRATLYKNIGVIQYDRESLPLEMELVHFALNLFIDSRFYMHAYFPRWAFDDVQQCGKWIFGAKGDGYVALYSFEPTMWASDYELRVQSRKNVWIVELGSSDEYKSFKEFVSSVLQAPVKILPLALGYDVHYKSPSQGDIAVSWNGPMRVDGESVDTGPYPRFDNDYCYQEFGTNKTIIEYGSQRLELDFNTGTRTYVA